MFEAFVQIIIEATQPRPADTAVDAVKCARLGGIDELAAGLGHGHSLCLQLLREHRIGRNLGSDFSEGVSFHVLSRTCFPRRVGSSFGGRVPTNKLQVGGQRVRRVGRLKDSLTGACQSIFASSPQSSMARLCLVIIALRWCPTRLVTILDLLRRILRLPTFCCNRLRCYSQRG